jgi:aminoglycoside phosphotransferase (APT) family kinase protein
VYRWLEGTDATVEPIADLGRAASDLARFIAALQAIDRHGGPPPGAHNFFRGEALAARDAAGPASIAALARGDRRRSRDRCMGGGASRAGVAATAVWIHGDLDARNVLVETVGSAPSSTGALSASATPRAT